MIPILDLIKYLFLTDLYRIFQLLKLFMLSSLRLLENLLVSFRNILLPANASFIISILVVCLLLLTKLRVSLALIGDNGSRAVLSCDANSTLDIKYCVYKLQFLALCHDFCSF